MDDYRKGAFNLFAPEGMPQFVSTVIVSPETHTLLAQTDELGRYPDPVILIKDREYCFVPGEGKTIQLWEAKP